jgi:hypothetical protein
MLQSQSMQIKQFPERTHDLRDIPYVFLLNFLMPKTGYV